MLVERLDGSALPLPIFISSIRVQPPHRVQGTVFLTTLRRRAALHNLPATRCCTSKWCA
jgi:KUP system potassium uptake protein